MAEVPTKLIAEQSKTFPGHGAVVLRVFDTKGEKASILKAKLQSKELVTVFDASNEEDITAQFKVKRASKEFAGVVFERTSVAFRDGELRAEFDWSGIRRIQLEAAIRVEKLAEMKRKAEEDRIAKEKRLAEDRLAEQERQREIERQELLRIQREKEAEELKKRQEQDRIEAEARQRRRAFEDKIGSAILNGGVMTTLPKNREESGEDETKETEIVQTWSDEHKSFYFTNVETNELTWRDPRIQSVWDKLWDADLKAFKFINKQTAEVVFEEPYSARIEKLWVEEQSCWYYVNRVTGDTETTEPYY